MNSNTLKWEQKLKSKNPLIREKFAESLGRRSDSEKVGRMLTYLLRDKAALVRSEAIKALMKINNDRYLSELVPLLDDKDEVVRVDAIECVALLGGKSASKYLIRLISDRSELVRAYAGTVLGEIGGKSYAKTMEKRLEQERGGLAKLGLLEGLFLLGQKERLSEILKLINSKRYHVRCSVANTLPSLVNKDNKKIIAESLINAFKREATVAAKSSIRDALKKIKAT